MLLRVNEHKWRQILELALNGGTIVAVPALGQTEEQILARIEAAAAIKGNPKLVGGSGLAGRTALDIVDAFEQQFGYNPVSAFETKIYMRSATGQQYEDLADYDIKLDTSIVEVTAKKNGKLGQIQDLVSNPITNPTNLPVILYAPNYSPGAIKAVQAAGGVVFTKESELLGYLFTLWFDKLGP